MGTSVTKEAFICFLLRLISNFVKKNFFMFHFKNHSVETCILSLCLQKVSNLSNSLDRKHYFYVVLKQAYNYIVHLFCVIFPA